MFDKFKNPIDYDKTIFDVTESICRHYVERLKAEAHKMSMEKYTKIADALKQFIENCTKDCFYEKSAWGTYGEVLLKISDARLLVENFFRTAKIYKDAKAAGQDTTIAEQNLANIAQQVKLRVKTRSTVVSDLVSKITPNWLFVAHVASANSK
ncbi:MAG: hypothetical protein IKS08_02565 [Alphaproteobacteria bacterium]|nr:hypothetical protein [Alphaproteobacteria bacterium]